MRRWSTAWSVENARTWLPGPSRDQEFTQRAQPRLIDIRLFREREHCFVAVSRAALRLNRLNARRQDSVPLPERQPGRLDSFVPVLRSSVDVTVGSGAADPCRSSEQVDRSTRLCDARQRRAKEEAALACSTHIRNSLQQTLTGPRGLHAQRSLNSALCSVLLCSAPSSLPSLPP